MQIPIQKPVENLEILPTEKEGVIYLKVDLNVITGKTVKRGHDVACATKGTKTIMAADENGTIIESGWAINCTIHRRK